MTVRGWILEKSGETHAFAETFEMEKAMRFFDSAEDVIKILMKSGDIIDYRLELADSVDAPAIA